MLNFRNLLQEFNIHAPSLPDSLLALAVDCLDRLVPVDPSQESKRASNTEPVLSFLPGMSLRDLVSFVYCSTVI